jgi:hypothetical protein
MMGIKCVFILATLIIQIYAQDSIEENKCFQVYDCCEKTESDCLRYCEPFIVCEEDSVYAAIVTTESSTRNSLIEPSTESFEHTTQKTAEFQVIAVGVCRKGFRMDGNKKCRRVMRK